MSKVTKSRRRPSRLPASASLALSAEHAGSSLTVDELLSVLMSRYTNEKQAREQERARHAVEVQDLKDISAAMWEQLQESRAREQSQTQELSRRQANQPKVLEKLKNLTKFVDGLSRDHHSLRDKARLIQDGQTELQKEKGRLFADINNIRQTQQAALANGKVAIQQAKQELVAQNQTISAQDARLQENALSLAAERSRNDLILTEIQGLGTGHKDFAQASAAQGNIFISKMNSISTELIAMKHDKSSGLLDELKGMLGQCAATINDMRDDRVKADDLQNLESVINNCMAR